MAKGLLTAFIVSVVLQISTAPAASEDNCKHKQELPLEAIIPGCSSCTDEIEADSVTICFSLPSNNLSICISCSSVPVSKKLGAGDNSLFQFQHLIILFCAILCM